MLTHVALKKAGRVRGLQVASERSSEDPMHAAKGRTAVMRPCRVGGWHVGQRVGVAEQVGGGLMGKELNAMLTSLDSATNKRG